MRRPTIRAICPALLLATVSAARPAITRAQAPADAQWAEVGRILQTADTPTSGYHRYNFPRKDLTIRMGDVTLATAMAFGTWAGFSGTPDDATMMGDLVLQPSETKAVLAELARQKIAVTAIHNHLNGETPEVIYTHYHAMGVATDLAKRIDKVIALTGVPRPVTAAAAGPVTIDTTRIFNALGLRGRAQGNVVTISVVLVNGTVTMDGHTVFPALGYGTPINLQAVSPTRLVATGDFSVTGAQLGRILPALAAHGITATAVHSHLIDESPHIYYAHFWADGTPADVLAGIRAALDAAK
jgi:hypothetical protein